MLRIRLAAARRRRSLQQRSALYFPAPEDASPGCHEHANHHSTADSYESGHDLSHGEQVKMTPAATVL